MGTRGAGWLRPEYREEFERDLRKLHERTGPWDLVLISGGLTHRGSNREFELLNSSMESFWVFLRTLGSEPFLLAVPGTQEASRLPVQDPALNAQKVREAFANPEPNEPKQFVQEAFTPFCDWLEEWQRTHPPKGLQTSLHRGLLPGDFALTVRKQGLDIGIVGLNSNFQKAESNYEISEEQLSMGSDHDVRAWASEKNTVLLLTHHMPPLLRYQALTLLLQNGIAPKGRYFLHLCGGWQPPSPSTEPLSSLAHPVPYYQAPSLFSGTLSGTRESSVQMGYAAGEIDIRDTSGRLRLFPRVVSFSRMGGPVLVPDERYPLEKDESVTISFPLKETPVLPGSSIPRPAAPPAVPSATLRSPPAPAPVAPQTANLVPQHPAGLKLQGMLNTGYEMVGWLAWAPTGEALALGLSSGEIHYWKPGEAAPRWVAREHDSKIVDLCFSPDGQMLASRDPEFVRLWNVSDVHLTRGTPPLLKTQGQNVAWSSRGLLAVATSYRSIEIWDTKTWALVATEPLSSPLNPVVLCLAWSPDGQMLACGGSGEDTLLLWDVLWTKDTITFERTEHVLGNDDAILHLAWMPGAKRMALASRDGLIHIWDVNKAVPVTTLELHTDMVTAVAFSFDGRLLASKSFDGTVRLFRTDTWEPVARLEEPTPRHSSGVLAFSPTRHVLASLTPGGRGVRTWELDVDALLRSREEPATVQAITAKVVLVGEGRAGKSCLALRMVKDSYEELGSTHGMQFWSIPLEPPEAASKTAAPQRELILWDMGGQSEYRLVHQLFLRDSTVALMVMEPGRGQSALDELEGWNQRFLAQTSARPVQKLLVGTKLDDEHAPENLPALRNLVEQGKYTAYLPTSAKTGRGISELKHQLARTIDWENIERVSRPRLFQRIRQHLQRLRQAGRVVLLLADLQEELREGADGPIDPEALRIVVAQLSRQGLVADTWLADGTRALILEVEQVERYAGSIVLAARDNPHGVPAIDVATVMSPEMSFPRIPQKERLRRDQELMVLDCVIQMLLQHDLCLVHQGLLIFPSLFQPLQQDAGPGFTHAVSLCYDFSGPIDTIYASLIALLAMSQRFGAMRLWEDRAEFGRAGTDTSGVRKVQHVGQGARGLARLDVYFDTETPKSTRELFVNIIEEHLREHGVELLERLSITCACGKEFPEETVRERLAEGLTDIGCQRCDRRTPLTPGAQQSRESNPALARQLQALRTHVQEQRSQSVAATRAEISEARVESTTPDTPLRILHLSDLHLGAGDDPVNLLQPLITDLMHNLDGPGVERLDHLVISGDLTNRASPQEFEKAYQFVSGLIQEFGLTAERCIIVPGNHDLDWDTEAYVWKKKRQVEASRLVPGTYRELGDGSLLLRDDAKYPERFKNFSQHFYHPLQQKEYPLTATQQCVVSSFFDSRLQFLALNSAWQIDESFQERSGIHEGALSHGLVEAERQLADARRAGKLREHDKVLRISVLHHPVTGNEKIQDDAFLRRLQQANVRLCMHGHVHEDRADLVGYLHPTRKLHVMGAGSFGAPTYHRPESVPRLYNLLEVRRDLGSVKVHTRCLRKQGGAWEAWAVWPGEKPGDRNPLPFYEVKLP
ncbi:MAG TPA: metallophosphoesterase [Archangium sp.]|uniref:metallophosphoesterase n=1 Tax=Archangium sp. TaxID=1872627 RepID=UPI002EDA2276